MNELEKLWKVLKRDSYTDKSFSEFQVAWEDDAYQTKVHDVVLRNKLTDKDVKTFKETYAATTPITDITSDIVGDVNDHHILNISNAEVDSDKVNKKLAENYFNLDKFKRPTKIVQKNIADIYGDESLRELGETEGEEGYANDLDTDLINYFGEKKAKQYLEYDKNKVWNDKWDPKNDQKKEIIENDITERNVQDYVETLSEEEIKSVKVITSEEAYKIFEPGDEVALAAYKAAKIKDDATKKQIKKDVSDYSLFDMRTWETDTELAAYKKSQEQSEVSKVLTTYFNGKYASLKTDSDLYKKQEASYIEIRDKWVDQVETYTKELVGMGEVDTSIQADVEKYNRTLSLLNGVLEKYQNELKEKNINEKVLLQAPDMLNSRLDKLNNNVSKAENLDMVAKALAADYTLSTRTALSFEEVVGNASEIISGVGSAFGVVAEYVGGTVEMASKPFGMARVAESIFGKGKITDLRSEGDASTNYMHDQYAYSLDYAESLKNYKETALSLNIDWEDANADNWGAYSKQLLGNNAFTIASALTYGGAIKAGFNAAKASNALSGAFFTVEAGSKLTTDYTGQKYAAENIEGLNIALSNATSPDERNSILLQIEDQEIYLNKTMLDKALSASAYGFGATYAERLGTMRYVRNMAKLKPQGIGFSWGGTYQGVKQTVFNTGIEYVEEFGTQVFHNLWDYAYMGENKSLTAGIDANFNANVIFSTLAIQAPSTTANVYNTIRSEVQNTIEVGANKTRAEEMIAVVSQLQPDVVNTHTQEYYEYLVSEFDRLKSEAALADSYTFARVANSTGAEIHGIFEANQKIRNEKAKLQNLGAQSAGDQVSPYVKKQKEKILNNIKVLLDQKEGLRAKSTERQKEVTAEILKDDVVKAESQFWIGRAFGAKNIAKGLGKVKVFGEKVIKNPETGKNEVDLTELETYLTKKVKSGKITEQQKAGYLKGFKEGHNASYVGNEVIYVEGNVIQNINNAKTNVDRSIHAYSALHELHNPRFSKGR